jgi:predicted aspartyl protease
MHVCQTVNTKNDMTAISTAPAPRTQIIVPGRCPAAAALFFICAAFASVPAQAKCEIAALELPITMVGRSPVVSAKINGTDVKFILDSGAFYSMISPAAAKRLKLQQTRSPNNIRIYGVGGETDFYITKVDQFTLKNYTVPGVEFVVAGNDLSDDVIGMLGRNLLALADVEYDLAHGVVRIVKPSPDCKSASLAYWATSEPVVELELYEPRRLRGEDLGTRAIVRVNDMRLLAVLDTGADLSAMSSGAAWRAGIERTSEGVTPAGNLTGIGKGKARSWVAPIKSLVIGSEKISNTHIRFAEFDMGETDLLLGTDFFLSHHIYVANSQKKIYMKYNGGPVFDLRKQESATDDEDEKKEVDSRPDSKSDAKPAPKSDEKRTQ